MGEPRVRTLRGHSGLGATRPSVNLCSHRRAEAPMELRFVFLLLLAESVHKRSLITMKNPQESARPSNLPRGGFSAVNKTLTGSLHRQRPQYIGF